MTLRDRLRGWMQRAPDRVPAAVALAEEAAGGAPIGPVPLLGIVGAAICGPAKPPVRVTSFGQFVALYGACPRCGAAPFDQFLPGLVERWGRVWWAPWRRRPPYAVICRACKQLVGWEWDGRRVRPKEA